VSAGVEATGRSAGAAIGRSAGPAPLRVLALAPLPFRSNGAPAFHGGGTVFYTELLSGLARRGHRVSVIAEAPPALRGERREGTRFDEARLEVDWFAYEHHSSVRQPSPEIRAALRLRLAGLVKARLSAWLPDVVLVGRETVLPYVASSCRERGVATLVVAHGPAVAELDAGGYPPDLHECLKSELCEADRIVAVADHVATALGRLGATRVETIHNVADSERFRPRPKDERLMRALGLPPGAIVLGHVSVLRPWKRVGDLVDSAEIVLRSAPNAVYVIVGDGPCRAELEEHVRRRGLAGAFRFTGEIAHAEVPSHLALADVVIQPSEREGSPLVYREVQACGRALLASDIPAAHEAIVPGRTGLLFPMGDAGALAAHSLDLVRDPGLRRRLGTAAREAASRHPIEGWLGRYEHALRRACAVR